jgi:GT2 family glycosyltransferase
MGQIVLSIVIGTYNRIDVLKQCLGALIGKIKVEHEIIVIDAGSTDGTLDYLGHLQDIRLVCDDGLIGQAQSLNRVFAMLDSKYVCWLSDDNLVQSGMMDQAVSILESDQKIGMVSLKVKDITGRYSAAEYLGGIWPTGVLNCNQGMLPVALIKKVGGFDERFRDYGIDSDLTTRVLLEGYKVVYTKRVAIHHLRDHEAVSWTDSSGRKHKLEMAKELYKQKYEELIRSEFDGLYAKEERENSSLLKVIRYFYTLMRKKDISLRNWVGMIKKDWRILFVMLGTWIGLGEKDWSILFVARFVSKMDFLINIGKPYYLVQYIPGSFLQQIESQSSLQSQTEGRMNVS